MPFLTLTIRWLDSAEGSATYHGEEWPPAPLRAYQALVAGSRRGSPPDARHDAALRHIESLPPPVIYAPTPESRQPVVSAVPNNDGDQIANLMVRGEYDSARKKRTKLKTLRTRAGWFVPGPVHYLWEAHRGVEEHLPALTAIADRLTCVGQGIDLAWATFRLTEAAPELEGLRHTPDAESANRLQVPYMGALAALEARHAAFRRRISGGSVSGITELRHPLSGYRSPLDMPARRSAAFVLRSPDDEPWSAEVSEGLRVAAMVRHAINEAAERAGLPRRTITELMGHGGDGRIDALPIPNVGHRWADGRVRRVIVSAPAIVPEEDWRAVVYRLTAAELRLAPGNGPVAMLAPAPTDDKVLWRYLDRATTWTTATPVVLPGWDCRRGKPRPERAARRLLKHAKIPPEAVAAVHFEAGAVLSGVQRAGDWRVPHHLKPYPRAHLTVRFREPVHGPLCLGAGAGVGLGLLTACEH